jgi:hypothetical protein
MLRKARWRSDRTGLDSFTPHGKGFGGPSDSFGFSRHILRRLPSLRLPVSAVPPNGHPLVPVFVLRMAVNIDDSIDAMGCLMKDSQFVAFPEELTIDSSWCGEGIEIPKYRLKAVIRHLGTTKSGHCIAYVRMESSWYECNDTDITQVDLGTVLKCEAYILFYEQF